MRNPNFVFYWLSSICQRTEASQIVELAVVLPVLVAIMLGVSDLGRAANVRYELDGIARELARVAATQSSADLTNPVPASIIELRNAASRSLAASRLPDCGLSAAGPTRATAASGLAWTFTAGTGCGGPFTLTIDRGYTFAAGSGGTTAATQVTISYPFSRLTGMVARSSAAANVIPIKAVAVAEDFN